MRCVTWKCVLTSRCCQQSVADRYHTYAAAYLCRSDRTARRFCILSGEFGIAILLQRNICCLKMNKGQKIKIITSVEKCRINAQINGKCMKNSIQLKTQIWKGVGTN